MDLDLHDIQSNVLRGYRVGEAEPHHRYLWLSLGEAEAARRSLAALAHHVTSCKAWDDGVPFVVNVGLTWTGLLRVWPHHGDVALGCKSTDEDQAGAECSDPAHSVLVSPEFVEGMARRAEILGDVDDSAPGEWESPLATDQIDAIVTISGTDEAAVKAGHAAVFSALADGATLRLEHRADALAGHPDGTEHFGFVDGIGQPYVAGSGLTPRPGEGTPEDRGWTPIAAGEFVLGYAGESGSTADEVHPWLKNCSYLALRRLEERVAEFRTYVARIADMYEVDPEWVAAKMIGRWRSGAPLMTTPDHDDASLAADPQRNNDFHYTGDRQGLRCPFGAHIRRTNPRDDPSGPTLAQVRRHRIIRRATPYGPWLPEGKRDDVERGVMFGVINAELRNQFEYVQLNWVNGAISSKSLTLGADRDPVVGANDGTGKLVVPRRGGPVVCWELPRFVRVRGGAYFLVPSLSLLARLAEAHP